MYRENAPIVESKISLRNSRFGSFCRSCSGSISVIMALFIPVLVISVGAAIDYGYMINARTKLDSYSDAAALAAVGETAVNRTVPIEEQTQKSRLIAYSQFDSRIIAFNNSNIDVFDRTADISLQSNAIGITFCYRARYKPYFASVLGHDSIPLSGCARASSAPPLYASFYFLVDASGSMGIGADPADQALMSTKLGCAFACHTLNWQSTTTCASGQRATTYCAKKIGAQTRFDVVKSSLKQVVNDSSVYQQVSDQYRFSLFKFSNYLTKIKSETGSRAEIISAIDTLDPDVEGAGTNMRRALEQIKGQMLAGGDGRSPDSRKNYLIILTDGVEGNVYEKKTWSGKQQNYFGTWAPDPNFTVNNPGFWHGSERSQAVDASMCSSLKANKVTIATLNTQYLTPTGTTDQRFKQIQTLLVPKIKETMQQCATHPDFAFDAKSSSEIERASRELFKSLLSKPRLTE